ncbi:MAG: hypothetical protein HC815_27995 [Richelia sp. RM1_1_1]|nr:hypothetical protein [Richelia sp. RM1_1_1]
MSNNIVDLNDCNTSNIANIKLNINSIYRTNNNGNLVAISKTFSSSSLTIQNWIDSLVDKFCQHEKESIDNIYENWQEWLSPLPKDIIHATNNIAIYINLLLVKINTQSERSISSWEAIALGNIALIHIKPNQEEFLSLFKFQVPKEMNEDKYGAGLPNDSIVQPVYFKNIYQQNDALFALKADLAEEIFQLLKDNSQIKQNILSVKNHEDLKKLIEQLSMNKILIESGITLIKLNNRHLENNLLPDTYGENSSNSTFENQSKSAVKISEPPEPFNFISLLKRNWVWLSAGVLITTLSTYFIFLRRNQRYLHQALKKLVFHSYTCLPRTQNNAYKVALLHIDL